MDERKGRLEANRRGLMTTGTLGVLLTAGELKLIDPAMTYRRLIIETTFRTSAALEAQFLGQVRRTL
jgi:predicted nucleic acid-binding protein